MNYLKRILVYIFSPVLFLLLIILLVEIRTIIALNDYSMLPEGVKVVDKVVLGRRERTLSKGLRRAYILEFSEGILRAFRRGVISLICTNQNEVLLLVQDFRLVRSVGPGLSDKGTLSIGIGSQGGNIKIRQITFLSREYFDTFTSYPLTIPEKKMILKALKKKKTNRITLYTFDGGNPFLLKVKVSEVKKIIDSCQ